MGLKERFGSFVSGFKKKISAIEHYDLQGYKNKRKFVIGLSVFLVVLVLSVAFFTGGAVKSRSLTGLVVEQVDEIDGLNLNLEALRLDVENKNNELANVSEDLNLRTQEVEDLESQIKSKDSQLSGYFFQIDSLENEVDELRETNENLRDDSEEYARAIESSAWSLCCTVGDLRDGTEKKWDIVGGIIECGGGDYVVQCDSGETDFG